MQTSTTNLAAYAAVPQEPWRGQEAQVSLQTLAGNLPPPPHGQLGGPSGQPASGLLRDAVGRPSSMRDVQQMLANLLQRQEQQQQQLAGRQPLAVPAASTTASPPDEDGEVVGTAAAAQAAAQAAAANRAPTPQQQQQQQSPAQLSHQGQAPAGLSLQQQQQQQQGRHAGQAGQANINNWMNQPVTALPQQPTAAAHTSAGASSLLHSLGAAARSLPPGADANGSIAAAAAGASSSAAPMSVPLLSSAIAAMLAGSAPSTAGRTEGTAGGGHGVASGNGRSSAGGYPLPAGQHAAAAAPLTPDALAEHVALLQQHLAAQAHEQQRQLSYVQSMHQWAGQIASSLRTLQRQLRATGATAAAGQEEAVAAKASLVQLAGLQDTSMQQVCQLSLEVADLKEQVQLLIMEGCGGKRRRQVAGGGRQLAPAQPQPQHRQQHEHEEVPKLEPELQPHSPKRCKVLPRAPEGDEQAAASAACGSGAAAAAAAELEAAAVGQEACPFLA